MKKKGQIQMMETIAVVFIFFLLVFFGIFFYSNIMKSNVQEKIETFQELSKIQVIQLVSSLPEIQCSQDNIVEPNCVDLLKLRAAKDIVNTGDYFDLFGYSKLTVKEVFPGSDEVVLYNREPNEIEGKLSNYFPISIYDAKSQNYFFGVLIVEVYT